MKTRKETTIRMFCMFTVKHANLKGKCSVQKNEMTKCCTIQYHSTFQKREQSLFPWPETFWSSFSGEQVAALRGA